MTEAAIRADNLTKDFDGLKAVDGLSFQVPKGKIFGLVGPDGAGKTTTIRLLATILKPTAGTATVAGLDVGRDVYLIRSRIGYVAQIFNLYQDLTVGENLDFFAGIFGLSITEREEKKRELFEFNRLAPFIDRRAGQLSGGMQKKLAVSCSLMHDPEIVLLDEPTTGVDPLSRQELWEILLELNRRGVTLLVSTTYMDEAARMDELVFIDQGRKIVEGSPASVRERYGRPNGSLEDAWYALARQDKDGGQ